MSEETPKWMERLFRDIRAEEMHEMMEDAARNMIKDGRLEALDKHGEVVENVEEAVVFRAGPAMRRMQNWKEN